MVSQCVLFNEGGGLSEVTIAFEGDMRKLEPPEVMEWIKEGLAGWVY